MAASLSPQSWAICASGGADGRRCACGTLGLSTAATASVRAGLAVHGGLGQADTRGAEVDPTGFSLLLSHLT
jgi:hypothetical protein